jgi:hypothetical protein
MSEKTESEQLFESFCSRNQLSWSPYGEQEGRRTPDYRIVVGDVAICVEIKQIESRQGLEEGGRMTRVVGDRIRREISKGAKQIRTAAEAGLPTLLLVYNCVDPLQAFGTEQHDFIAAMYGDWTVPIVDGRLGEGYNGPRGKLRTQNTSFSALGLLRRTSEGSEVIVYENMNARRPIPYDSLPSCFTVVRTVEKNAT